MDAIKFMKEKKRMCESYSACIEACPLKIPVYESGFTCIRYCFDNPEKAVEIVEKWSAEHPIKTRQSEFLKMFPNADIQNDVIRICPKKIDQNSVTSEECSRSGCFECRKKYWLAEVE